MQDTQFLVYGGVAHWLQLASDLIGYYLAFMCFEHKHKSLILPGNIWCLIFIYSTPHTI